MRSFEDKVVVITGAAGGMGSAFARRFGAAGARLALLDVDTSAASRLAAELTELGVESLALGCDVSSEQACRKAMEQVAESMGGIDVLVNNAGITHRSAFAQTSSQVFRRVMAVNFFGAVYCTQAALASLVERRGLIVTVSSIAGFAPLLGRTGYAASKHALHGLFDSLRCELAGDGVGVLIVCPGFTATGISTAALDADGSITSHQQSTTGRIARPAEVAEAVFQAARRSRRLLVLSRVGRTTRLLTRVAPGLYERLMSRSLRAELQR